MIFRNRLIGNYLGDKHYNLRLFDIDHNEVIEMKCNEILQFKKSSIGTRLKNFYDEFMCFSLRYNIHYYSTYYEVNLEF